MPATMACEKSPKINRTNANETFIHSFSVAHFPFGSISFSETISCGGRQRQETRVHNANANTLGSSVLDKFFTFNFGKANNFHYIFHADVPKRCLLTAHSGTQRNNAHSVFRLLLNGLNDEHKISYLIVIECKSDEREQKPGKKGTFRRC